jgi:hypothetical protein
MSVKSAAIDYGTSCATIESTAHGKAAEEQLLAAVANTPHAAPGMRYTAVLANRPELNSEVVLTVEGMMCAESCGTTVKAALEAVAGTSSVEVRRPFEIAKTGLMLNHTACARFSMTGRQPKCSGRRLNLR